MSAKIKTYQLILVKAVGEIGKAIDIYHKKAIAPLSTALPVTCMEEDTHDEHFYVNAL